MLHHPALAKGPAAPISATALFTDFLPKILTLRAEASRALGGRLGVQLRGAQAFTVDFTAAKVVTGIASEVTALLELTAADCEGLMQGKLDVSALEPGRITCTGDAKALRTLAVLLNPQPFGKPPRSHQ